MEMTLIALGFTALGLIVGLAAGTALSAVYIVYWLMKKGFDLRDGHWVLDKKS